MHAYSAGSGGGQVCCYVSRHWVLSDSVTQHSLEEGRKNFRVCVGVRYGC